VDILKGSGKLLEVIRGYRYKSGSGQSALAWQLGGKDQERTYSRTRIWFLGSDIKSHSACNTRCSFSRHVANRMLVKMSSLVEHLPIMTRRVKRTLPEMSDSTSWAGLNQVKNGDHLLDGGKALVQGPVELARPFQSARDVSRVSPFF